MPANKNISVFVAISPRLLIKIGADRADSESHRPPQPSS
jgi:hypothetical protein